MSFSEIRCLCVAVILTTLSCGGGGGTEPEPQPNRGPVAIDAIPAQMVITGETAAVNLAPYFSDPDGDALTYGAESSDATVVTVGVSGSTLTLAAKTRGTATVTVTALDPAGLSARQGFQVLPPARGFVAGRIVAEEDPTLLSGYGFGPNPFDRIARIGEEGPESACERPCHEIAVTMGSDTTFTDREGRFVFDDVDGGLQHQIHVVEAAHPRRVSLEHAPSTFWHYFMFDTTTVSTAWNDTVEVVLDAREVGASITVFVGAQPGAPRYQGYTGRIPGVTVTLFASDGFTVLERRMTDELGEVVFRPLERNVTYYLSPAGGYDGASYRCLDPKGDTGAESVGWHVCEDLNSPPWTGGSGDRAPGPRTVVGPSREYRRQPGEDNLGVPSAPQFPPRSSSTMRSAR